MIKIKTMKQLADAIEQFFYERGEYEYFGSDRIRWLENLTEREDVAKKIYDALENKEFQLDKLEGANRALCTNCSLRKFK